MKIVTKILMNDMIDKHNQRMSLEVLESAKEQTNSKIMSSHREHDFRFPPIARIYKAFIKNENGVNNLYGEIELFEKNDINKENIIPNKKLSVHQHEDCTISYDRSFELNKLENDVNELQNLLSDNEPIFELKKSFEPVSTLIVFIVGIATKSFIEGFFNKAGSDFWDKLNTIVMKNASTNNDEKLYIFNVAINKESFNTEVIINFTNPINYDIKSILTDNKDIVDYIIEKYEKNKTNVSRIVFNSTDSKNIQHEYSVYHDGTPFDIRDLEQYDKIMEDTIHLV
jgi:hypothetical protein